MRSARRSFRGLEIAVRVTGGKAETVFLVLVTVIGFGVAAAWLGDRVWESIRWW
jgi:hypothetical protein